MPTKSTFSRWKKADLIDLANKLEIDFETPKEIELKAKIEKLESDIQEYQRVLLTKDAEIEGYRMAMKNIRI